VFPVPTEPENSLEQEDNVKRSRTQLLALSLMLVAVLLFATTVFAGDNRNYTASLKGRNEVPAVDTNAQGQAIFHLSKDGAELSYKLIVANIDNVTQAHIHCGAPGVNGPVVAFLFGFVAEGVTTNGVLAEGTITAVIPRPDSPACPGGVADFDDLLEKLNSGGAYVNVHTLEWPGGEIRGPVE
jgi:hypothetical protein